jgi:hypothetical protein
VCTFSGSKRCSSCFCSVKDLRSRICSSCCPGPALRLTPLLGLVLSLIFVRFASLVRLIFLPERSCRSLVYLARFPVADLLRFSSSCSSRQPASGHFSVTGLSLHRWPSMLCCLSSRAAWFLLFAPQSVVGSRRFSSVFLTCERSTPSYVAHVWSPVPSSSFSASFPRRRFGPSVPMKSTGRSIFLVEIPALRAGAWICSPVFLPPVSSCHSWSPICCLLRMFLPDAVLSPFFLCREQGAARISCRGGRCSISVSRSRACISCSKLALFSAIFVCNSLVQFSRVGGARPGLLLVLVWWILGARTEVVQRNAREMVRSLDLFNLRVSTLTL